MRFYVFINSSSLFEESPQSCQFKDGFELFVLPGHVMLARLNEDFPLTECSKILVSTFFLTF